MCFSCVACEVFFFGVLSKKPLPGPMLRNLYPAFPSTSLTVSGLNPFKVNFFLNGIKLGSDFIHLHADIWLFQHYYLKKFRFSKWLCRGSYNTTRSAHLCADCVLLLQSECFVEQPRSHVCMRKHTKTHHIRTTQCTLSRPSIMCAYRCCASNHCRWWCSEIKRRSLLGRKAMTNLDSIFKSRDIALPTKVHLVKVMVFPVVVYGYESWTIKKAERRRMDALELWCWRRLLRVFWTARGSNQSILKEMGPEYSLEGLMLKLKLQSFGHLMRKVDSFEKTLMLGKIEGRRRTGWQTRRWLDGIIDLMDVSLSKLQELEFGHGQGGLMCCNPWGCKELNTTEWLNWTETFFLPFRRSHVPVPFFFF